MENDNYFTRQEDPGGNYFLMTEKAKKVVFAGFENFDFFVSKNRCGYVVTEGMSGATVTSSEATRSSAIRTARGIVLDKALDIINTIKLSVSRHGISPRYKGIEMPEKEKYMKLIGVRA